MKSVQMTVSMLTTAVAAALAIGGCKTSQPTTMPSASASPASNAPILLDDAVTKAVATVGPSKSATTQPVNNNVTGTVTFELKDGKLTFVADIDGLAPGTEHGFHIHEKGDLSDPDLKSAGGHFNPTKEKHGGPDSEHHHAGDLGNLKADDKGHAHLEGTLMHGSLSGDDSIVGRSVIIHAKADDLKSDPAGNSGARIAGGTIK